MESMGIRACPTDRRSVEIDGRGGRMICGDLGDGLAITLVLDDIPRASTARLTNREQQVLSLVAKGFTDRETAEHLGVRVSTVRGHVENIRKRLSASTRAEAVAIAMESDQLT